jgi:DNA-binding CsgD family transcriptional regulator
VSGTTGTRNTSSVRLAELGRLVAALDRRHGGIVELTGEPGSGKTRLLADLASHARDAGTTVLAGRCNEFEQAVPFRPFTHTLNSRPMLGALNDLPAASADLIRCLTFRPDRQDDCVTPARPHLYTAIRLLLERGTTSPTLLILDDFHWADTASVELIDFLVSHPIHTPLSIVVAQRTRQTSARLRSALARGIGIGVVDQVRLDALTLAQSGEILGMPEDDETLRQLHAESGGNPLYLLALAQTSAGAGPRKSVRTRYDNEVPSSLATLLFGELASLGRNEFAVASAASVLGDQFGISALSAVAQLDDVSTETVVAELVRRDLLRPVDTDAASPATYTIRHPVLRSVIYASTDPVSRSAAHRRALTTLSRRGASAAEQAVHIERSLDRIEPSDLPILTRAARDSMATAPGIAAHWLQVTLRALLNAGRDDDARRLEVSLSLTRALGVAGHLHESRDLLHELLEGLPAEPRGEHASAVAFCALMECFLGHYAEASTLLATELDAIPADDTPIEAVSLIVARCMVGLLGGEPPIEAEAERAVRVARLHNDRTAEIGALTMRALSAAMANSIERAVDTLSECVPRLDALPDAELDRIPEYFAILGWTETRVGRYADAGRHFNRGIAVVRRIGQSYLLPLLLIGLANAKRHRGAIPEAQTVAAEAAEIANAMDAQHARGMALAIESWSSAWTAQSGDRKAVLLAEMAVTSLPPGGNRWSFNAIMVLANAVLLDGEAQRCITLITSTGGGPELPWLPEAAWPPCFEMLAEAAVALGDIEQATAWATRATKAVDPAVPVHQPKALAARAHVRRARCDFRLAATLYQDSADLYAAAGMICDQALMLVMAARCHVNAGIPRLAEPALHLAKKLAKRCGAHRVFDDAEQLTRQLAPQWIPPQRTAGTALSTLTNRERQIAGLAGTGMRTREIAEQLSVSPRTVDVHLSRIYRKLDVSSRAALARLLAELDSLPPLSEPGRQGSAKAC